MGSVWVRGAGLGKGVGSGYGGCLGTGGGVWVQGVGSGHGGGSGHKKMVWGSDWVIHGSKIWNYISVRIFVTKTRRSCRDSWHT